MRQRASSGWDETLAQKLVSEFNATHSNLKVRLTLTSINDDTTPLATSIRAGNPARSSG